MRAFAKPREQGSILLAILVMMPFFMAVTIAYLQLSVISFRVALSDQYHTHAQFAADAGVDYSIEALNQADTWTGTGSEVTLHTDSKTKTTYQTTVITIDADHKTIESIGRTYHPATATTPSSYVKVSVPLRPVRSGDYSIVSGVGGLILLNSAKVVSGSVYVNGTLSLSSTSQIGLAIAPVDVKVAHQSCPKGSNPGASYPKVCGVGENGQPITINNSAHIYGTVEATNQTTGSGMSNTGLIAGSSADPIALPDYDRAAQKTAATNNMTAAAASCNNNQTITWPANTKITGDVTVAGKCVVTVNGNVWITGNLKTTNQAQIAVKSGLATAPVIMIDGSGGVNMRNSSTFTPNAGLIGFRIITFYSTDSCSPDCTSIVGSALYNSQQVITVDLDDSVYAAQTEFYARWTKITAGNSGTVGAFVGQTVELKNSLAVTLGTRVTGVSTTVWILDSYRRIY